jgi:tetratricopeptide (TPR) repeat protein
MKSISTFALAASLAIGGLAFAAPAEAQKKKEEKQAAGGAVKLGDRTFNLSKEVRPALGELQKAVTARDAAAFATQLAAAQATAKTADDRYLIARLQFDFARATANDAAQTAAIEAMIASGSATAAELPTFHGAVAEAAYKANQFDKAAFHYEQMAKLQPNNPDILSNLAIVRNKQGKSAESTKYLSQAMAARAASGQAVPEDYYKRVIEQAYKAKNVPLATKTTYEWLSAFPTQKNWADALQTHRALVPLDDAAELDRFRLMRSVGALRDERSHTELARYLLQKGLSGEAKSLLEEGASKNLVSRTNPTVRELLNQATTRANADRPTLASSESKANAAANGRIAANTGDAYMGYGDYAKAAAMYRVALSKGGADTNLVNTRLGMSLAMAGDKAGAKTAFGAVTGPRAELARYWILWLDKRA